MRISIRSRDASEPQSQSPASSSARGEGAGSGGGNRRIAGAVGSFGRALSQSASNARYPRRAVQREREREREREVKALSLFEKSKDATCGSSAAALLALLAT